MTPRKPRREAWKIAAPALLVSLMLAPELARAQSVAPAPTVAPEAPPPPAATAEPPELVPEPPPPPVPAPAPAPPDVTVAPAPPPPEVPVAPSPPEGPSTTAPPVQPGHGARTRAFVLLGVGGASLLVGTVFGLLAVSTKNDVFDNNPTYGEADAVRSQSLIADVGLGLGVILVASGTVFLVLDRPPAAAPGPASTGAARVASVRVEPVVSPHGGGGALTLRF